MKWALASAYLGEKVNCWKSTTNTSCTQRNQLLIQAIIPALGHLRRPYSIVRLISKEVYVCVCWFIYIFCGCVHVCAVSHVCTHTWRSEVAFRCLYHCSPYVLRQSLLLSHELIHLLRPAGQWAPGIYWLSPACSQPWSCIELCFLMWVKQNKIKSHLWVLSLLTSQRIMSHSPLGGMSKETSYFVSRTLSLQVPLLGSPEERTSREGCISVRGLG